MKRLLLLVLIVSSTAFSQGIEFRKERYAEAEGKAQQVFASVENRQHEHKANRGYGSEDYVRGALAESCMGVVGKMPEQGKHEQSQNIVYCHNTAGGRFADLEGVLKNERDNAVVHLPKCADGKECKAHKESTLVVKFHSLCPLFYIISRRPRLRFRGARQEYPGGGICCRDT